MQKVAAIGICLYLCAQLSRVFVKMRIALLVKSSLVFVLVEGGRSAALKFWYASKEEVLPLSGGEKISRYEIT